MEVTIQYVDGCPHLDETYRLVAETIESTGSHGVLRTFLVGSMEEAEQLHFPGSPTVLIDGVDPFAHSSTQIGLHVACMGLVDLGLGFRQGINLRRLSQVHTGKPKATRAARPSNGPRGRIQGDLRGLRELQDGISGR